MTRKDFKLSETSKRLPENPDLWEELEDKSAEKIRGGDIFSFVNNTNSFIPVTVYNGAKSKFTLEPFGSFGVSIPGSSITVEFNDGFGLVDKSMSSDTTGIFETIGSSGINLFFA